MRLFWGRERADRGASPPFLFPADRPLNSIWHEIPNSMSSRAAARQKVQRMGPARAREGADRGVGAAPGVFRPQARHSNSPEAGARDARHFNAMRTQPHDAGQYGGRRPVQRARTTTLKHRRPRAGRCAGHRRTSWPAREMQSRDMGKKNTMRVGAAPRGRTSTLEPPAGPVGSIVERWAAAAGGCGPGGGSCRRITKRGVKSCPVSRSSCCSSCHYFN